MADVEELLPRVFEFSEFLTKRLGLEDVGAYYPHRVTYHASCHGLRNLGLGDGPQRLLRAVRGIDLVEIEGLETCCGFGGTFAVKNADVSGAMLEDKIQAVLKTKAEACTACDNSCLMHIQGALHRQGTGVGRCIWRRFWREKQGAGQAVALRENELGGDEWTARSEDCADVSDGCSGGYGGWAAAAECSSCYGCDSG